jgi:hypothetical protein
MAAFDPAAELHRDLAFRLLINTSVTLFWRQPLLDETSAWLSAHGYQVTQVDASTWMTEHEFHAGIAAALSFHEYYGHNLDAFNDCMRDVVAQDYGWRATPPAWPWSSPATTRSRRTARVRPGTCSTSWPNTRAAPLSSAAA